MIVCRSASARSRSPPVATGRRRAAHPPLPPRTWRKPSAGTVPALQRAPTTGSPFLDPAVDTGERRLDAGVGDVVDTDGEGPVEGQTGLDQHGQFAHRVDDRLPRPAIHPNRALRSRPPHRGHGLDGRQALATQSRDHLVAGVAFEGAGADRARGRGRAIAEGGHDQPSRVTRRDFLQCGKAGAGLDQAVLEHGPQGGGGLDVAGLGPGEHQRSMSASTTSSSSKATRPRKPAPPQATQPTGRHSRSRPAGLTPMPSSASGVGAKLSRQCGHRRRTSR